MVIVDYYYERDSNGAIHRYVVYAGDSCSLLDDGE